MQKPALALLLTLSLAAPACLGEDKAGDGAAGQGAVDGAAEAPADGGAADSGAEGATGPDCAAAPLDCDDEDNDCDGEVDEGGEVDARVLWARDGDEDGFPVATPRRACEGVAGAVRIDEARAEVDCDDGDPTVSPRARERCLEEGDEDCNGDADCVDSACRVDACFEDCDDGINNDGDWGLDCHDPDCYGPLCPEDCATDSDEDGDRVAGCLDPDCWGPACEELCNREGDEDGDGLTDCEDADCAEDCIETCRGRWDDDRDGLTDCDDPDCTFSPLCWQDLELRTVGPIQLRVHERQTSESPWLYESTAWFGRVEIATATFVGRVPLGASSSVMCSLRANSFAISRAVATVETPFNPTFNRDTAWASFGVVGPDDPACPGAQLVDILAFNWSLRQDATPAGLKGIEPTGGRGWWLLADRAWDEPIIVSERTTWGTGIYFSSRWSRETTWVGTATGLSLMP